MFAGVVLVLREARGVSCDVGRWRDRNAWYAGSRVRVCNNNIVGDKEVKHRTNMRTCGINWSTIARKLAACCISSASATCNRSKVPGEHDTTQKRTRKEFYAHTRPRQRRTESPADPSRPCSPHRRCRVCAWSEPSRGRRWGKTVCKCPVTLQFPLIQET